MFRCFLLPPGDVSPSASPSPFPTPRSPGRGGSRVEDLGGVKCLLLLMMHGAKTDVESAHGVAHFP